MAKSAEDEREENTRECYLNILSLTHTKMIILQEKPTTNRKSCKIYQKIIACKWYLLNSCFLAFWQWYTRKRTREIKWTRKCRISHERKLPTGLRLSTLKMDKKWNNHIWMRPLLWDNRRETVVLTLRQVVNFRDVNECKINCDVDICCRLAWDTFLVVFFSHSWCHEK